MDIQDNTREDILRRYKATMERKRQRLAEIESDMRKRFKERTGEEPSYFFAL